MNSTIIVIKCKEVEIPESTLSKVMATLHADCDITKAGVQVLSQKDIDAILEHHIVVSATEHTTKEEEFTPEENAAVYISSMFNNDFTTMFPTRLAIKLNNRTKDDPLVKAVKIISSNSASYARISKKIREKYNFTREVFCCIREVAKMLYNNV